MRCKLVPNTNTNFFRDIKICQLINQELNYSSITSILVMLYKYLLVHDFVRLTHGLIHILTKLYCFGGTFTLSLVLKSVFA